MQEGWVCPKCGKVYAPVIMECYDCNKKGEWSKKSREYPKKDHGSIEKLSLAPYWSVPACMINGERVVGPRPAAPQGTDGSSIKKQQY